MMKTEKEIVGIHSQHNQCWFCARCGYKPKILQKRKRWGVHKNNLPPRAWSFGSVYYATNFNDAPWLAREVCDKLNAENPTAKWAVVRFKEVCVVSMKVMYKPQKDRTNGKAK